MRHSLGTFVAVLLFGFVASAQTPADRADAAVQAAMPSYDSALLSSARGDRDGTLRHLALFRSQWRAVVRLADAAPDSWLHKPNGPEPVGRLVVARIDAAQRELATDVSAAHESLESIRHLLQNARPRGSVVLDDAVTSFHTSLERLTATAGHPGEIPLEKDDFDRLRIDVGRATTAWQAVASSTGFAALAGAPRLASEVTTLLAKIAQAVNAPDAMGTQRAAQDLRSRYFDLLAAMAARR